MQVHDLTLPASTATVRAVLSAALRRLAHDLARLRPRARPEIAQAFERVRAAFLGELAREPGRAFAILRRPNAGAQLRVLRELDAPSPRVDALTASLSATLAVELVHAGADLSITLPSTPARVVCLGGRFVLPGGGPATLAGGRWSIEERSGVTVGGPLPSSAGGGLPSRGGATDGIGDIDLRAAPERPFHPIDGGIVLATVDDNPLAMVEAHPDKQGNALDLGGRPASAWVEALRDGLARVEAYLPIVREEMELVLHQMIPVGADDEKHLSASYREALGTIYLTLHPSAMTMTEAILHEFAHNKLNAMLELDPLLENAFHPLFASPVRPDPRPLHGVLLAVHAFLPVAALYRAMIERGDPLAGAEAFHARYRAIIAKNRAGVGVLLENARPTEAGRPLLDELRALDASFAS